MESKQNATIYDVAEKVGVSLATVSRVVNGNPSVRQSTKEKVLKAIDELGYQPNAVARGLASKKTTTIGVVLPDVVDMYYSELARGIDDIANMYHYDVLLANTDEDPIRESMAVNNLASKQVDGIIFMGNNLDVEVLKTFHRLNVPVVLAGSLSTDQSVPSVNIDYLTAVKEATGRLLANGHDKIALVIASNKRVIDHNYRVVGYQTAYREAQKTANNAYIFPTRGKYADGYALGETIIEQGITALVAYDDEVAVGVMNYLRDHDVSIPESFELITADDTLLTQVTRPQMTSISQPKYDIGAVAMRMLTKLMNKENLENSTVKLPHGFVIRETTK